MRLRASRQRYSILDLILGSASSHVGLPNGLSQWIESSPVKKDLVVLVYEKWDMIWRRCVCNPERQLHARLHKKI